MRLLVVGNGAREHATVWKLAQSSKVSEIYVAPGNGGTAQLARNVPIAPTDIDGLLCFARDARVDFTIIGPEAPLAAGIVNKFGEAGFPAFGPTREAARIESSKSFAKNLMICNGVPTGTAETFDNYDEAAAYIRSLEVPIVVKADGLAAGKGVVICETYEQGLDALRFLLIDGQFGPASERVLVEEYLEGPELSVFAFVDGTVVSSMVGARDYKRLRDGDTGPNTGGMGSFSPSNVWTLELEREVRARIVEPIISALAERGTPYKGILYSGLMLTDSGPKVIEFNCRFGDPEAQVVLPRLKTDLLDVMMRTVEGNLESAQIEWDESHCVGVVVASGGYPGDYDTGHPVDGLGDIDPGVSVFQAGTSLNTSTSKGSQVLTDGGRVLTVVASGETLAEARCMAYKNVARVRFKDSFYRGDIAAGVD